MEIDNIFKEMRSSLISSGNKMIKLQKNDWLKMMKPKRIYIPPPKKTDTNMKIRL